MGRTKKALKIIPCILGILLVLLLSAHAAGSLLEKYGYGMMKDGTDYCLPGVVLFNPNYSLKDWFMYFRRDSREYLDFYLSDEFQAFSLKGKMTYPVPYVNINGDMDYQANNELAQAYFDAVRAPQKDLYLMKNTSHGLLESKSEEFSELLHQVHKKYKRIYR